MINIAVFTEDPTCTAKAERLAAQLRLPCVTTLHPDYAYFVLVTAESIGLQKNRSTLHPLLVDFLSDQMTYRRKQASLRREMLARALGLKNGTRPRIVDATAGLGRDSFIIACLGFEVTLLERSPITYTLLADGIERAREDTIVGPIVNRMHLLQTNAVDYLSGLSDAEKPDIIYLDPMFPERSKSALVKKEMQIFHDIIGDDADANTLLTAALTCATTRVVVKRPRTARCLTGPSPSYQLEGKSSRFDVYLVA